MLRKGKYDNEAMLARTLDDTKIFLRDLRQSKLSLAQRGRLKNADRLMDDLERQIRGDARYKVRTEAKNAKLIEDIHGYIKRAKPEHRALRELDRYIADATKTKMDKAVVLDRTLSDIGDYLRKFRARGLTADQAKALKNLDSKLDS